MFWFVPCAFFSTNNFAHTQTLYRMWSLCRSYEYCAGKHCILYWIQENKTATYFLRSRLFTYDIMKISTAISIKHRILATFDMKKKINSDSLYAFKVMVFNVTFNNISVINNMAISFIGGGKRSTRRKPSTRRKSLTNFIT